MGDILEVGLAVAAIDDENSTPTVELSVKMPDSGLASIGVGQAMELGIDLMGAAWRSVFVRSLMLFMTQRMRFSEESAEGFVATFLEFHREVALDPYDSIGADKP